jgi:hypothetical protein
MTRCLLLGGAAWFVLSVPVALVAGRLLRRASRDLPPAGDPPSPPA